MHYTSTATAKGTTWADQPGGVHRYGMRLQRGKHFIFVPDTELLELANQIADYLQHAEHRTTN